MFDIIGDLHAASRWFETVAARHQHGIAVLEALSTTAAVVVALWSTRVARGASKPKLKARVSVMQIFGNDTDLKATPTYIAVRLTNIGNVPIRMHSTCFSWRLPSSKTSWAALPLDENGRERWMSPVPIRTAAEHLGYALPHIDQAVPQGDAANTRVGKTLTCPGR